MSDPAASDRILTRGFCLAFVSSLCYFGGIGVVLPVLPIFVTHQLGGDNLTVGIVVGIFAASAVLARPIAGRLGNRLGRRMLMVAGAATVAVSVALYGVAGGLGVLVLLRLVTGAGEGVYFTGSATLVADMAPPDRRAQVLSYFSVALFAGLGIGPLLGQAVYSSSGAATAFVVAGALAMVGSLVATQVPNPGIEPATQRASHLLNRKAIGPGLVLTLGIMGVTAFQAYTPLYAEQLHMAGPQFVFLLYAVVVLVTRVVGAPLADRVGVKRIATLATGVIVLGLGTMALWATPTGLYVGSVPFALGISLQYPALMTMVVNRVEAHERAAAVGTFTTAFDLSQGAAGVILGGVAAAAGYRASFGAAGGFALIGLVVFLAKVGRTDPSQPAPEAQSERAVLGDPDAWLPPGAD
ncbi:MAG TPA: MFS transporter [Acidimicrobiales bacterium]|nr:MFS transporter [Acidimicrobiales bacterium]